MAIQRPLLLRFKWENTRTNVRPTPCTAGQFQRNLCLRLRVLTLIPPRRDSLQKRSQLLEGRIIRCDQGGNFSQERLHMRALDVGT